MDNTEETSLNKSSQDLTITFLFTDRDVGAIIGRNGNKIREIKSKTQCRLVFHGKIGGERFLSITGNQENLLEAVVMVANSLLREPRAAIRDLDETGDFDRVIILLLLLPHNTCGAVIGKQGSVVKKIVNDTGAKILVFFERSGRPENGGIAKIQGSPEEVRDAVMMITDIIKTFPGTHESADGDSPPLSPKLHTQNTSALSGMSHKTSQTLYIDNRIARVIVGRGGSTINEIRKISKAYIQVSNTDNRNESSLVISGDPSSVAVALHLIELRISSQFPNMEEWGNNNRGNFFSRQNYRPRSNYDRERWPRNDNFGVRNDQNEGLTSKAIDQN